MQSNTGVVLVQWYNEYLTYVSNIQLILIDGNTHWYSMLYIV